MDNPGRPNRLPEVSELFRRGENQRARAILMEDRVAADPGDAPGWLALGEIKGSLQESGAAVRAYKKAVELAPDDLEGLTALAWGLFNHGSLQESAESFRRLARTPGAERLDPGWRFGLGQAEGWLGNTDQAMEIFLKLARENKALVMRAWREASFFDTWHPLAQETLQLARRIDPSDDFLAASLLKSPLTFISEQHFLKALDNLDRSLDWLIERKPQLNKQCKLYWLPAFQPFYYYRDMLPYFRKYGKFIQQAYPGLSGAGKRPAPGKPNRLRLGIALNRIGGKRGCTDDDMLALAMIRFIQQIDKTRFQLILFHPDHVAGNENSKTLTSWFDESHPVPGSFAAEQWIATKRIIEKANLDILLHEDFGAYSFLGFSRLAPVQCQFFDSCLSMALPETDYVFAGGEGDWLDDLAPQHAEKLALFKTSFCWGNPGSEKADAIDLAEFGVPPSGKFMFTWHEITRWRLGDDVWLAALLRRNRDLWLLNASNHTLNFLEAVKRRWRLIMPDVFARIRFIPWQTPRRFHAILSRADIALAPPADPGTISTGTAISRGIPVVAMFGETKESRVLALAYDIIGVEGLTARDADEYAAINQRLLDDREWKAGKSREILANAHKLYDLGPAVKELTAFLEAAHERARNGLPPAHWRSGGFAVD